MSPYLLIGPAAALIGIVAVIFVMRHKSVQTRSMYSSRRSQIERKVKAARQRTLVNVKAPTATEIAAATAAAQGPAPGSIYEAPAHQAQSWDAGAAPAPPVYAPPPPPEAPPPPPPPPPDAQAPYGEPPPPPPSEPVWTPTPVEPSWTPSQSPAPPPLSAGPEQVTPVGAPAGSAAWSVVNDARTTEAEDQPAGGGKAGKGGKRADAGTRGSNWQLASGEAPAEEGDDDFKQPSATMAIAQYAVLVLGLIMVLIGVLVMVANQKSA